MNLLNVRDACSTSSTSTRASCNSAFVSLWLLYVQEISLHSVSWSSCMTCGSMLWKKAER